MITVAKIKLGYFVSPSNTFTFLCTIKLDPYLYKHTPPHALKLTSTYDNNKNNNNAITHYFYKLSGLHRAVIVGLSLLERRYVNRKSGPSDGNGGFAIWRSISL